MQRQQRPRLPTMIDDPGYHRKGASAPLRPTSPGLGPRHVPWAMQVDIVSLLKEARGRVFDPNPVSEIWSAGL